MNKIRGALLALSFLLLACGCGPTILSPAHDGIVLLPAGFRDDARDTLAAIVARMKKHDDGYSMEEISMGTNPSNASWYKVIPQTADRPHGNGAFLLLAHELADETFWAADHATRLQVFANDHARRCSTRWPRTRIAPTS